MKVRRSTGRSSRVVAGEPLRRQRVPSQGWRTSRKQDGYKLVCPVGEGLSLLVGEPMKSRRSSKTEVWASPVHGRGLFCRSPIRKDEFVGKRGGEVVDRQEAARRDAAWECHSLQLTERTFLCPRSAEDVEKVALFINHSCDPNIGFHGRNVFVAMRDINAGEELTADYATGAGPLAPISCTCRAGNCRRRISGEDWRDETLQRRYKGYFTPFVAQHIAEEAGASAPPVDQPAVESPGHPIQPPARWVGITRCALLLVRGLLGRRGEPGVLDSMLGWYHALVVHGNAIPPLTGRFWHVDVFVRWPAAR